MNPFRPRRIRITEPGWAGYTGFVGPVEFADAVSVDPVSAREQQIVGAIIRTESADEDEEGAQVGPAIELIRSRNMSADHERVAAAAQAVPTGEHGEVRLAIERYTREELEEIADRRGIGGLRDIATPYGVKGRSITELITAILKAQNSGDPASQVETESADEPAEQAADAAPSEPTE